MNAKRLFELLVVGGTVVGLTESCGSGSKNSPTTTSTSGPSSLKRDGGVSADGGETEGTGVGFW